MDPLVLLQHEELLADSLINMNKLPSLLMSPSIFQPIKLSAVPAIPVSGSSCVFTVACMKFISSSFPVVENKIGKGSVLRESK